MTQLDVAASHESVGLNAEEDGSAGEEAEVDHLAGWVAIVGLLVVALGIGGAVNIVAGHVAQAKAGMAASSHARELEDGFLAKTHTDVNEITAALSDSGAAVDSVTDSAEHEEAYAISAQISATRSSALSTRTATEDLCVRAVRHNGGPLEVYEDPDYFDPNPCTAAFPLSDALVSDSPTLAARNQLDLAAVRKALPRGTSATRSSMRDALRKVKVYDTGVDWDVRADVSATGAAITRGAWCLYAYASAGETRAWLSETVDNCTGATALTTVPATGH